MNRQSALRVGTMVNQGEGLGIKPVFAKGMPEVGTVVYLSLIHISEPTRPY